METKDVFTVMDMDGGEKSRWVRIGIGFVNKDASLNLKLDALPVNGRLHIRDRKPRNENQKGE